LKQRKNAKDVYLLALSGLLGELEKNTITIQKTEFDDRLKSATDFFIIQMLIPKGE